MRLELLNTGTELLLGSVLNTHVRFLAAELFPLGLRIERQVAVPDGEPIRAALLESFSRAEIVLVTGGLGPTTDDVTRDIAAEVLGVELVHDEEILRSITERFVRRGLTLGERVRRQAQRPREARVLPNGHGTAPGLYLPPLEMKGSGSRSPHLFLLPGPPRELEPMFRDAVLPILRGIAPREPGFALRNWRLAGIGESHVEERVGEALLALGIELGYCARPGEVELRVIGSPAQLEAAERVVAGALAAHVVSEDERTLERVVVDLLAARGETLATAESCTGGGLAHCTTNVPGASAVFAGGFVTYSNELKTSALGVDARLIREHGAVSREVAAAMAAGALERAGADWALATTGIAGPGGGTPEKPVGTVHIALASRSGAGAVELHRHPTDRETFKDLAIRAALDLLRRTLLSAPTLR